MPARRRRRAPGSRRGRARGLLDRCTRPMLATSRAAAIECDAVDVAVGDRLQDAFAALAFSRAFEYSAYHHSASRTLTTNQPSVTGVSPDPESSRRASSTTPYCRRLLVEYGLRELEDYREPGRRAGASGQPRRPHRRRGSSPVASAVRDSGCRSRAKIDARLIALASVGDRGNCAKRGRPESRCSFMRSESGCICLR